MKKRRTIEISDDVDYLIKAFKAKMLLETGVDHSYNDTIELLTLWTISTSLGFDENWIIERMKADNWEKELRKHLTKRELLKALKSFIKNPFEE